MHDRHRAALQRPADSRSRADSRHQRGRGDRGRRRSRGPGPAAVPASDRRGPAAVPARSPPRGLPWPPSRPPRSRPPRSRPPRSRPPRSRPRSPPSPLRPHRGENALVTSTTIRLVVPSDRDMADLVGQGDHLLKLIEDQFESRITVRGNEIAISGDAEETQAVSALFSELIELMAQGREAHARTRSTGPSTCSRPTSAAPRRCSPTSSSPTAARRSAPRPQVRSATWTRSAPTR